MTRTVPRGRLSDKRSQGSLLLFRSGKIVCSGAKSTDDMRRAVEIVFEKLRDLSIPVEPDAVTIQNIVSLADLGHHLNLNAIAIGLGFENIEYEPEQFPGLVYRIDDPKATLLLFHSGKIVITGAEQPDDAEQAVDQVRDRLDELDLLT